MFLSCKTTGNEETLHLLREKKKNKKQNKQSKHNKLQHLDLAFSLYRGNCLKYSFCQCPSRLQEPFTLLAPGCDFSRSAEAEGHQLMRTSGNSGHLSPKLHK